MLKYLDLPLPDSYEVHFAMDGDTEAIPMIGNADGVEVPNSLLERSGRLAAYLYLHDTENDGETEYVVYGTVRARQKPTGAEPTPEQADVIAQAISALNTAVDEAEAAADAIENLGVTAETLSTGLPATVEKTVDPETGAVTLEFGLPRGDEGVPGADGVSPTISVTDITGGHRITITDAGGDHTFDVMDGVDGANGNIVDVQVNGTSVVTSGVANIPIAGSNSFGAVKVVDLTNGIGNNSGLLYIAKATDSHVQAGTANYRPIVPANQDAAAFYGLAKAAGDTSQSASSNAVGSYTEDAKSKISQMLNGAVPVTGSTPSITAKAGIRYECSECSTLDITLPASGDVEVIFESGSTATVLTITPPTGVTSVKWPDWFDPDDLDADVVYDIIVTNGEFGVVTQWAT